MNRRERAWLTILGLVYILLGLGGVAVFVRYGVR